MPKYGLTRKVNMERFFPEMRFENADFTVEGCDSPEQAEKEIKSWIKSYITGVKEEKARLANPTIPPEADLSDDGKPEDWSAWSRFYWRIEKIETDACICHGIVFGTEDDEDSIDSSLISPITRSEL